MKTPDEVARDLAHAIDEWGGCFDCCTDSGVAFDRLRPNDDPAALNGQRIEAALLDLVQQARADAYARALAYLASVHGNLESNGEKRAAEIAQGWLVKATADLFGGGDTSG